MTNLLTLKITEIMQIGFIKIDKKKYKLLEYQKVLKKVSTELLVLRLNQNFSTWNNSNVTDMSTMFYSAKSFVQDLSSWNVKNVVKHFEFAVGSAIVDSNLSNFNKYFFVLPAVLKN